MVRGRGVELYADDALIYFASKSVSEIQIQLTSGLTKVVSWLHANFLIILKKLGLCLLAYSSEDRSG